VISVTCQVAFFCASFAWNLSNFYLYINTGSLYYSCRSTSRWNQTWNSMQD